MPTVTKGKKASVPTKTGGSYSYTYADLADVTAAGIPVLGKHGLSFTSRPRRCDGGDYELEGVLMHTSGETSTGSLPLHGRTPQELGSALTYARRYLFGCLTVKKLAERAGDAETLITVHASAGVAAMTEAVKASPPNVKILAITALTSFTDDELISIYRTTRTLLVNELAVRATMAGVPGIVCATNDLPLIKHMRLLTVVPGIRLPGDNINDQVHVGTGEGADLAVIGRPITQASNPLDAVKRINDFFQQNGEKK
jgi:3-keto-L-gulonate-6-phosphate decarboxylase